MFYRSLQLILINLFKNVTFFACLALTSYIFQLYIQESIAHPDLPTFFQCTDHAFMENHHVYWILWHTFVTLCTYFFPLTVIITCYSVIVYTIYSKGKKFCGEYIVQRNYVINLFCCSPVRDAPLDFQGVGSFVRGVLFSSLNGRGFFPSPSRG